MMREEERGPLKALRAKQYSNSEFTIVNYTVLEMSC